MSELGARYAANQEDVAAKVIDGELIVIRLSDGTYYSMDNVGAQAWELLTAGVELSSVVQAIASSYGVPQEQVEGDLSELVQTLLSEQLIVAVEERPGAGDGALPAPSETPYAKPELAVYRDMGNLLALDPPTPGIDELLLQETPD